MSRAAVRTLILGVAVFTVTALLGLAVVAGVQPRSPQRLEAAMVAAGICWFAALPGLVLFVLRNDPDWGLKAALTAMVLRLFVCLGAAAGFEFGRHPLLKAGVNEMLVIFYLAFLAAETGLFVWISSSWPAPTPSGPSKGGSDGMSGNGAQD